MVYTSAALSKRSLGALVSGNKKDVVIPRKYAKLQPGVPKPVVIYGWHKLDGSPTNPYNSLGEECGYSAATASPGPKRDARDGIPPLSAAS